MNIPFPAGNLLTFAWLRADRFSFILPGCLLLSLVAHAATFFLFQIAYPERVTISPPAPSVTLLDARRPDHQALWRLIEAEDPAPMLTAQTAVPGQLLEFPYRPSYSTVRTWPQTLPETPVAAQFPTPRDPIAIIRSANPAPPAAQVPAAEVQTRVIFGGDLAARGLQRPIELSFTTKPAGPLAPARFLLGVNAQGEVAFAFLQSSSGDSAVDAAAAAQLGRVGFAPNQSSATWGHAVFVWGDDVYEASGAGAEKSECAMIRVGLTTLLLIYLAGMLILVCVAWVSAAWRRRAMEHHAWRHVLRCALCNFEFEDSSDVLLPQCPRCNARNERGRRRSL